MKLATLKDSTRDGKLVVVSKDLTRCSEVGHIARTLQAALDDWAHVAPRLERVAIGLETGSQPTMRFHEHDAASPLPRAFSWSGGAGFFNGPRDSIAAVSGASLTSSVQAAVIVDDTQAGSQTGDIALVMLAHGVLKDGNPIAVAFSPVAVTPDEIEGWENGNAALPVIVGRNGKAAKTTQTVDFNAAVTAAVRERSLGAGSVLAAETGAATPVAIGDVVRVEMNDRTGHSIFGAIEQTVQAG